MGVMEVKYPLSKVEHDILATVYNLKRRLLEK